ncbi:hypothetical protein J6X90_01685 [Candidatus Saccharibacteria bacterium]|nr:hypothetical protein [Candidatus Saccharibacteria bacterium]
MIKKIIKRIMLAVGAIILAVPSAAFALDRLVFVSIYVPRINYNPVFYISRIDIKNNELEFVYNTDYEKQIARFGAAWVKDEEKWNLPYDSIRTYPSVDEEWSEKIFWSGDYELEIEKYITSTDGSLAHYVIESEADLKENDTMAIYYIVETTDDERWVGIALYNTCGTEDWGDNACYSNNKFIREKEYSAATYYLDKAPVRKVESEPKRVLEDEEPIPETKVIPEPEVISEPEPETIAVPKEERKMEEDTPKEENTVSDEEVVVTREEDEEPVLLATIEIPELEDELDADEEVTEIEEESEDNIDIYSEDDEVYEGFGETTLDVPILGNVKGDTPEEKPDLIPIALISLGLGAILAWFLLFIVKMTSTSKKLKYKD